MEKEKVLEIKIERMNNEYSVWCITYQNEEIFKRREFIDSELIVYSSIHPAFCTDFKNRLFLWGKNKELDNIVNIIPNYFVEQLKKKVNAVNEKYGILKRWKPEINKRYYVIDEFLEVASRINYNINFTKRNYIAVNCFETREEAEVYAEKFRKILAEREVNKNE